MFLQYRLIKWINSTQTLLEDLQVLTRNVCPHLSVWRHMSHRVVVVSPLVLLLGRPHPRVRLSGAIGQGGVAAVVSPHGRALVVFRLVALGEDKALVLGTWTHTEDIGVTGV